MSDDSEDTTEFPFTAEDIAAAGNLTAEAYRAYQQTVLARRLRTAGVYNSLIPNGLGGGTMVLLAIAGIFLVMNDEK